MSNRSNGDASQQAQGAPTWLIPAVIILVVGILIFGGRKNRDVVENPLVDFAIITIGVFAFAAAFRWIAVKGNQPGLASFFSAGNTTQQNS
jgi:hypothetical protein